MFDHMKVVCLSVGLLVILSGLNSVSSGVQHREAPAKKVADADVSLHMAQSSVVTAVVFRSLAISY
jgi:hypothetical protein